jgi:hypothetical protein
MRSSLLGLVIGGVAIGFAYAIGRVLFGDLVPFFLEGTFGAFLVGLAVWVVRTARRLPNMSASVVLAVVTAVSALVAGYGLFLLAENVSDLVASPVQVTAEVERVTDDGSRLIHVHVLTTDGRRFDAPFFATIDHKVTGLATLTTGGVTGRVILLTPLP